MAVVLGVGAVSTAWADGGVPAEGRWRAWLDSPGGQLPFGLELKQGDRGWQAWLVNGPERIEVPRVTVAPGAVVLDIMHYDSTIRAEVGQDGRRLDGQWVKRPGTQKSVRMAFHALAGLAVPGAPGLPVESNGGAVSVGNIDGRWTVQFSQSSDPAVGVFETVKGQGVVGTIMTTTGDYRYLAGSLEGSRLRLSVFDGAHAFLFDARLGHDGMLRGDFWSGDAWHERWTGHLDPSAKLGDAFGQTLAVGRADLANLVFPDATGTRRRLADLASGCKLMILEIMGTWCPNCHDAGAYLADLHRRYGPQGVVFVSLAFEVSGEFERDARQVRRFVERHGIAFPVLIAGTSDKAKVTQVLPMIDRLKSYPTTLVLDPSGKVISVYTGFTGPATGEAYEAFRREFEALVERELGLRGED